MALLARNMLQNKRWYCIRIISKQTDICHWCFKTCLFIRVELFQQAHGCSCLVFRALYVLH